MPLTKTLLPEQRIFPGRDESSKWTSEEKSLAQSLERVGFHLKPGHRGKGEALRWASCRGFLEEVHLLLRTGPNEQALQDADDVGFTAAHEATVYGKPDILRALIEAGADISLRELNGKPPLHYAARQGHSEIAELLLRNGSDPTWADDQGRTASHEAAKANQCNILRVLAAAGDDLSGVDKNGNSLLHAAADGGAREAFEMLVNTRADTLRWSNDTGWTPVHVAVVVSSVEMVKFVLDVAAGHKFQDSNFDIDSARHNFGVTPLMEAARAGTRGVVELLLNYGANPHIVNDIECSALYYAVLGGHTEVVRVLIHRGADINARIQGCGSYAVLTAVHLGHIEILEALLESGARLSDVTTNDGHTVLHIAARQERLGLLRRLLHKALSLDVNALSHEARTPLIIAAAAGRVDAVRMLLGHGANTSTSDNDGWTPLHWAVKSSSLRIVRMLLEHGADPTAKSASGETALSIARTSLDGEDLKKIEKLFHHAEDLSSRQPGTIALRQLLRAAESGSPDLITNVLRDQKIGVNSADDDGYTSLLLASENGQDDAVSLLIGTGAEVNAKNTAGESCIWLASRYGHEETVRMLIENGADLDSADELKQTAISAATEGGHLRVMEILLDKGADISIRTIYGKTAFGFAVEGGHGSVIHALLAHGNKVFPQIPFEMGEISFTITEENEIECFKVTLDSNSGRSSLGLVRDPESRHFSQATISSEGRDRENADHEFAEFIGLHASDDAEDSNSEHSRSILAMAERGMNAAVDRLLRANHALKRDSRLGCFALFMAAWSGHVSTVRTLLYHGFKPDLQDSQGVTALYLAADSGRNEVVQALIHAGANINTATDELMSPLMVAALKGHIKVLDLLLTAGASKELIGREGLSALGLAVASGNLEVVKHLLKFDVNLDGGLTSKTAPLSLAIHIGDAKMVRLLLEAGAAMQTWPQNRSLLCVAAQLGFEDVVTSLLEHGVEVDRPADRGWTPLIYAAACGHGMVARILVEMGGANVKHRDEQGRTAQSVAKMSGHEGVAAVLRHASRLRSDSATTSGLPDLSHYTYSPLSKPSCIRVLDLHPGQENHVVSFDLYQTDLDMRTNTSYHALSYEWKGETASVTVLCNGRSILVTPNLRLALQKIRLQEKARTLWVDAVCINQKDIEERSSQVQMMPTIYRKASKVLMWLGRDSPTEKEAIVSIPAVLSAWTRAAKDDIFSYVLSPDAERVAEGKRLCTEIFTGGESYSRDADDGAAELLRHSYFTRAWIHQELVLAGERGIVLCGPLHVPWNDFIRFAIMWASWRSNRHLREQGKFMQIARVSAKVASGGENHMGIAMEALAYLNCSEPKDRVFAVLGVVDPSWLDYLTPDYRLSVQQVYTNAARVIIRRTRRLDFWMDINHPAANNIPGLPSWVPDWTCLSTRHSMMGDGVDLPSLFREPAGRSAHSLVASQFHTTETALYADGYLLDEIAFGLAMRPGEDIYNTIIRPLVQNLARLGLSIFDRCPYPEELSYLSVFCRFIHGSLVREVSSLDSIQLHTAFLTWKIISDPNTPEESRKVPPELESAVQDHVSRSSMDASLFDQHVHEICSEMETLLIANLRLFTELPRPAPGCENLARGDLYCTRSGYLGVAGEGTAESGLVLVLLEGFASVAMMRKKEGYVGDRYYEFVDGADILEVDWGSYRSLDESPINGKMERLKIM